MDPLFLKDVEANPQPCAFASSIAAMQAQGAEYPQIWHLFAYLPEATRHLSRFTHEILRGPAPLSPGLRELIAAYTSARNHCLFWLNSHAAVAAELLNDEPLVKAVLENPETAPLDDQHKALFRFIDKVNHASPQITPADIAPLHAAGWTDEAIYFAITVCALFNFYNRWIDSTGVHPLSPEAHRQGARRTAQNGYRMD